MNNNEKNTMITRGLKRMEDQRDTIRLYLDNPFEEIEVISTIFTDICFAFAEPDGVVNLSKLFDLHIYDWKAACCKMQRAIERKDETVIHELLLDALAKLDRKILHFEAYLKTGSFALHE